MALYGAGSLAWTIFTSVVPLRGEPDLATIRYALANGVALVVDRR